MCDQSCYNYRTIVSVKQTRETNTDSIATHVVMQLMEPYLTTGRYLCTDNYYTSMELINKLQEWKPHFIVTFRRNRKGFPEDIVKTKLKNGEVTSAENTKEVVAMKWRNNREVLMVSTRTSANLTPIWVYNNKCRWTN